MDMNSPEAQSLLQEVKLGIDALRFLESDLGGYIAERCISDRAAALEELADVDPFDYKAVSEAQTAVKLPTLLMQYINDAVQSGEQAERIITGPEE